MADNNLALWNAVETTDPRTTKNFSRGGGFKGTAISPMALIKRATERWGPMGGKWGFKVVHERIADGAPMIVKDVVVGRESVHILHGQLWYYLGDEQCVVESFGQTTFCGQYRDGRFYTDEEAPKKSLTDALTKALSWLGFAADVHMGRFDDVKYVNDLVKQFEEDDRKAAGKDAAKKDEDLKAKFTAILETGAETSFEGLSAAWKTIPPAWQKQLVDVKDRLKAAIENGDAKED